MSDYPARALPPKGEISDAVCKPGRALECARLQAGSNFMVAGDAGTDPNLQISLSEQLAEREKKYKAVSELKSNLKSDLSGSKSADLESE
jgi:hypothetical protein